MSTFTLASLTSIKGLFLARETSCRTLPLPPMEIPSCVIEIYINVLFPDRLRKYERTPKSKAKVFA